MYAFGSTIDSWTNASSGCFAVFAYETSLSRSGPTFPVAFAALSVWHAEQPLFLKTRERRACAGEIGVVLEVGRRRRGRGRRGSTPVPSPALFSCFLSHLSNAAGVITIAWLRMSACPRPQSSVQIDRVRAEPVGRDVELS